MGTAYWMRGLAILSDPSILTNQAICAPLSKVQRRQPRPDKDTEAYAYMLMALHNLAALREFNAGSGRNRYNTIRSAIVAWYYCVYECSSAMVLAQSGDSAEEHRTTARLWHRHIAQQGLLCAPFSLYLDTLVTTNVHQAIQTYRAGNPHDLSTKPTSDAEALGATISYLNGTADFERDRAEKKIRDSKEFKALGVSNFRTSAARTLRDKEFAKGFVNFPIQAFRYRGKANYRDSIYLSYGANWKDTVEQLSVDLEAVAQGFFRSASALVKCRTERGTWDDFAADIKANFKPDIDFSVLT
jgi:uncharacterized protein (UPF0332 family)